MLKRRDADEPDSTAADVETSSDDYARRFAGAVGRYFLDAQLETTLELLRPWPGASILDVGGGHGQLAVPLAERGFAVTVAGSSDDCEKRLKRMLPPGSYAFRRCDLLELPFEDRGFSLVLAFRLLPHVDRWQQLIQQMCRVAAQAVIVDYPDKRSVNFMAEALFRLKKAIERDTRPYRCFGRRELTENFGRYGFGEAVFRPQFTLPMVAHRAVGSAGFSRAVESAASAVGLTRVLGSPVVLRVAREAAKE